MKVRVDYNDGTEPEELEVTDGSVHFHPFPDNLADGEKPAPTVEVLEEDPVPEEEEGTEPDAAEEGTEEVYDGDRYGNFILADHSVAEVKEFVGHYELTPEDVDDLISEEEEGANRVSLLDWLNTLRA